MNTFDLDLNGTTAAGTPWSIAADRDVIAVRFGRFRASALLGVRSLAAIASTVRVSTEVVK
uniref:Uncharacterized protein n=1 Tax=Mycobacterium phage Pharb TaxID=3136626 RepID=A0AAU8GPA8_9VIRU